MSDPLAVPEPVAPPLPDLPAHLASPPHPQPQFSWNYIWSFFMRAPRVRSWLFQKTPPPATHVVQSLLSSPMLVGYIFGSFHERSRVYAFPDIGDLQTAFCRDGDAILGFHFGFQGIQPIMPLLFQVIKDPVLSNPNVIVRRTVRQRAPFPYHNYYLAMEFDWFESGILAVASNVSPIDPDDRPPTGLCPFILHGEHRVFSRQTADKLSAIAHSLEEHVDLAFFPHPSHFVKLPPDLLDPPDDYYFLTVNEPDNPSYHASLEPAYVPPEQKYQTFAVEMEIPNMNTPTSTDTTTANSTTTTNTSHTGTSSHSIPTIQTEPTNPDSTSVPVQMPESQAGATLHCDPGEVSSVAERGTIALWKSYQQKVAQSRRTGIILTMLGKKIGGRSDRKIPIFGRESRYVFLSTSGINVHGRIQRLCSQLGIEVSSPLPDNLLISSKEEDELPNSAAQQSDAGAELDISGPGFSIDADWERRRFEAGLENVASRADIATGYTSELLVAGNSREPPRVGAQGYFDSLPARSTLQPGSGCPSYTSDGKGSDNAQGMRHPKRRRYAVSAEAATVPAGKTGVAMPVSSTFQEMPPPPLLWGSVGTPVVTQTEKHNVDEEDSQLRSFDLTHILVNNSVEQAQSGAIVREDGSGGSTEYPVRPNSTGGSNGVEGGYGNVKMEQNENGAERGKGKAAKTVWTCDRCGVQIRGKRGNLNRHIANKHENIRAFACMKQNCGRKFQTRLNLVRHERAVHEGRPHTCSMCPRAFKYEEDLNAHVKSAHSEADTTLACEICGSCFGRRSTLNRHITKVHKPKEEAAAA